MTTFQPVIEPAHLRLLPAETAGDGWSPARLLHWNESVRDLLDEVPPERRRAALRQIQREVERWRNQQTPEQLAWTQRRRKQGYRGTIAAAEAIVEYLR